MPRIRTVKPEFWVDEKIVELNPWARLLFIGLWNFADDQGYVDYSPRRIRMQIFPGDTVDVEPLINDLCAAGVVRAYDSPVGPVLHIVNWTKHQRVDKASKPRFNPEELRPFPSTPVPVPDPSPNPPGELLEDSTNPREDSRAEGKGSGRDLEVPPTAERAIALAGPPDTTQALVGEWISHCRKRPPNNVIGQVSKQVKAMLAEGIDPADVRRGFAEWARKGIHPSTLPSVVNEVMNAMPRAVSRPSTTDARVADALAAGERVQAQMDQARREIPA